MSDPIAPPSARRPEEAPELVALAVSDGDLGAALAQYETGAPLRPWCCGAAAASPDPAADGGSIRDTVLSIMDLRLPLTTRVIAVLPASGLTLVLCERRIGGTAPDGQRIRLTGLGCTVVRAHPDGAWRIAADAWCLADSDSQCLFQPLIPAQLAAIATDSDPPTIPPHPPLLPPAHWREADGDNGGASLIPLQARY